MLSFRTTLALGAFALVSLSTPVLAEPCTAAQLAGNHNYFRFTGSGGSYSSGTQQVVSFDHPLGSPVVAITDVDVVAVSNGAVSNPVILSGVPTAFVQNAPDSGASVSLVLPNFLAAGTYFYRVSLTSGAVLCTLDSLPFDVGNGNGTGNVCTDGSRQCISASTYSVCAGGDWGGAQLCSAGTQCNLAGLCTLQSGGGGTTCSEGQYTCSAPGTSPEFSLCAYGTDGKLTEIPLVCPEDTNCVTTGDSITCQLASTPGECELNQRRCVSDTTYQICETCDDSDTEWGSTQNCAAGLTCSGEGVCSLKSTPPRGECEINGHMRCLGSDQLAFQTCDQNAWVDFSCAQGTVCQPYMSDYILCGFAE